MFSSSELAAMTATIAESLGAGSGLGVSLVLYRGAQVLAAQDARLVRPAARACGRVTARRRRRRR